MRHDSTLWLPRPSAIRTFQHKLYEGVVEDIEASGDIFLFGILAIRGCFYIGFAPCMCGTTQQICASWRLCMGRFCQRSFLLLTASLKALVRTAELHSPTPLISSSVSFNPYLTHLEESALELVAHSRLRGGPCRTGRFRGQSSNLHAFGTCLNLCGSGLLLWRHYGGKLWTVPTPSSQWAKLLSNGCNRE